MIHAPKRFRKAYHGPARFSRLRLVHYSNMEPASAERRSALVAFIRRRAAAPGPVESFEADLVKAIAERLPWCNWVGFYMLDPADPQTLVLGPFVGEPTPHTRIPVEQGICGAAVASRSTIVVDDVNADPRYLACSIKTRSEIVVPIFAAGEVVGELDIDSHTPAAFTVADREFFEEVARIVGGYISRRRT